MTNKVSLSTTVPSSTAKTIERAAVTNSTKKPIAVFNTPTDAGQEENVNNGIELRENYKKDFYNNVNKNIDEIINNPKFKKVMEKYKDTPLYKDIQRALNGDEQAILTVLSDKNFQKDIDELLKDKDIQEKLIDIAPSKDMKEAVKNILGDEEIKKQVFEIANNKNVDENVKKLMENSKVQDFVKSILNNPEIKEAIKERTRDFPMKNRLFDCLDNPIVQFGLVKTIMSNDVVQKAIADAIKNDDISSLNTVANSIIKSLTQSNNFLSNSASILQVGVMGGMTAGAAAGDVIGSYIPIVGRPIFSTIGAITGTVLGGITGIFGGLGYVVAGPYIRDAVASK